MRSSYRAEWNFPGGTVKSGETPDVAAARELVEEIGLAAPQLSPAGEIPGAGVDIVATAGCGFRRPTL